MASLQARPSSTIARASRLADSASSVAPLDTSAAPASSNATAMAHSMGASPHANQLHAPRATSRTSKTRALTHPWAIPVSPRARMATRGRCSPGLARSPCKAAMVKSLLFWVTHRRVPPTSACMAFPWEELLIRIIASTLPRVALAPSVVLLVGLAIRSCTHAWQAARSMELCRLAWP